MYICIYGNNHNDPYDSHDNNENNNHKINFGGTSTPHNSSIFDVTFVSTCAEERERQHQSLQSKPLGIGHWKLDTGHCTLDTGQSTMWIVWTLDTGHWKLDTVQLGTTWPQLGSKLAPSWRKCALVGAKDPAHPQAPSKIQSCMFCGCAVS